MHEHWIKIVLSVNISEPTRIIDVARKLQLNNAKVYDTIIDAEIKGIVVRTIKIHKRQPCIAFRRLTKHQQKSKKNMSSIIYSCIIFFAPGSTKRPTKYRNISDLDRFKLFADRQFPDAWYYNVYEKKNGNSNGIFLKRVYLKNLLELS